MDTLIDNLPPLIEEGKICYCESGGSLIYRPAGSEEHPSVLHLPVPEIKELQRRTKQSDKANQFLDSPDEGKVPKIQSEFYHLVSKVSCVFPMVVVPLLPHAEFGPNDHQEDTPHFSEHI